MKGYLSEAASPAPTPGKLEQKLETEAQKLVAMQERIYSLEQIEENKRNPTNPPTLAPPTSQPTSLWHTHEHPECPATPSDISRCALERGCCSKGMCVVGNNTACDRKCSISDMLTYCLSGKYMAFVIIDFVRFLIHFMSDIGEEYFTPQISPDFLQGERSYFASKLSCFPIISKSHVREKKTISNILFLIFLCVAVVQG
jgi:hypothetical protein